MQVKTGAEIVKLHQEYQSRIVELELCIDKVAGHDYVKRVLEEQIADLRQALQRLESSRFQALEPVNIVKSMLGGVSDKMQQ